MSKEVPHNHSSRKRFDSTLDGAIRRVLGRSLLPLATTQIARLLRRSGVRLTKTVVNRRLYAMEEEGTVARDETLRWYVSRDSPEAYTSPAPDSREPFKLQLTSETSSSSVPKEEYPRDVENHIQPGAEHNQSSNGAALELGEPPSPDRTDVPEETTAERYGVSRQVDHGPEDDSPASISRPEAPLRQEKSVAQLAQQIVRMMPEARIDDLPGLNARIANQLRNRRIRKVSELVEVTDETIASWKNIGTKAIAGLKWTLENFGEKLRGQAVVEAIPLEAPEELRSVLGETLIRLAEIDNLNSPTQFFTEDLRKLGKQLLLASTTSEDRSQRTPELARIAFIPVLTPKEQAPREGSLRDLLAARDERAELILNRRILRIQNKATLEELGEQCGVTRERIRQIERRLTEELAKSLHPPIRALDSAVEKLRSTTRLPLTVSLLEERQPAFAGVVEDPELFARLLELGDSRHAIIPLSGIDEPVITSREFAESVNAEDEIERRVQKAHTQSMTSLSRVVEEFLGEKRAEELWPVAMGWIEGSLLVSKGIVFSHRIAELITGVVEAAERPLRVEEIEDRLRQAGHRVTNTSVRGAAPRADGLYLAGPATFASRSNLAAWEELKPIVREAVLELMETAPQRQWSDHELVTHLRDRKLVGDGFDRYVLRILLETAEELEYLGRGVWVLEAAAFDHRLPIRDLAVKILRKAGAPLKKEELDRRVLEMRPLGKTGINVGGPLAMVDVGVVGLAERDLGLTTERHEQVLRRLQSFSADSPATLEKLEQIWSEVSPDGPAVAGRFLAAAIDSDRIARHTSEGAGKSEATAVKDNARGALRQELESLESGTRVELVRDLVEEQMGRRFTDIALKTLLRSFGLTIQGEEVIRG
jgi:hypothetical protein